MNFFVILQAINQTPTERDMKRNFLPNFVGIAMTKGQFCFCTGCTPYKLRTILHTHERQFVALGYNKWDKLLMPAVVRELLAITGLRIDVDYYSQYVVGQRGIASSLINQ